MRNKIALLLAVLMLASALLCGCGEEKTLEPWTMPAVDAKPTVEPTPIPTYGGGSPEEYIWNEAESFDMSDPGAALESVQETLSHNDCLALFPYNFLPTALFTESYSAYQRLNRQKTNHDVLRDPNDGGLAEHSYVEFVYLPSGRDETRGLTVMAELCSYDAVSDMYFQRIYPHISYPEQAKPQLSKYYLDSFVLARFGDVRLAQILKLPSSSYFTDAEKAAADAAENGEEYVPARQILLTITCGETMSDEEFIAAVCTLLKFSDGSEITTPEESHLPVPGEKGAA